MILEDVQKLEPGNVVTMFELDFTALGGHVERFHNYTDGEITWQGEKYFPWAIAADGFSRAQDGRPVSPKLSVGNIGQAPDGTPVPGVVTALCRAYGDLRGAWLIRRRTMARYLDAVNFPGGNPHADPNAHFPDEKWIVEQKETATSETVVFRLSSPLSFGDTQLPTRQIIGGLCWWLTKPKPEGGYRGVLCGYTGAAMYDENGNPVVDPSLDKCSGLVSTGCKPRFGEWNELRFGGFPAAGRYR